jgi:uncharacterized protein (UPF0548 family)
MTNPCVSLQSSADVNWDGNRHGKCEKVVVATKAEGTRLNDDANRWWPSLSFAPTEPFKWTVKTYRQKVGNGFECYEQVRDAALGWEFCVADELGILPVTGACENSNQATKQQIASGRYTVMPSSQKENEEMNEVPMHQCIGAARRFVSFTSRRMAPFLPKIYSVNPIMSVFDVVDQRGPATTFSSSAYATMKGHLLRGEERVTVALRDGNEDVEVEIVSVSRAAPSLCGRLVWPFIGKMQSTFFESQMEHLRRIGGEHSKTHHSIQYSTSRRRCP